ncbi:MAG: Gfo/Idh/MocA family oxidoreductase [Chloroflexota bacterium]
MANSKKIRVGIAGLDHFFAGLAAVGEIAKDPQAELVIIAHRDRDRAKQTAAQLQAKWTTDYAAVLNEDIDLLITACPTNRNAELVIAAAEKGIHVLSVKPFAMNLEEADKILAAVEKAGITFMSFDATWRLGPLYQQAKEFMAGGKMGRPVNAFCLLRSAMPDIAWFGIPFVRARTWWLDPEKVPGGGWLDHAIYYIDVLRWLYGSEVVRVSGEIGNLKHPDEALEDFGVATFVFQNGAVATVEVTWTAEFSGLTMGFQLVGTEGQLHSDTIMKGSLPNIQTVSNVRRMEYADPILGWQTLEIEGGQGEMTTHMLQVLRGEAQPIAQPSDARANLAACLAFYEAAKGLKTVQITGG